MAMRSSSRTCVARYSARGNTGSLAVMISTLEEMRAVVPELGHRIADVVQRQMGRCLLEDRQVRRPMSGQYLDCSDVQIAVMEEFLQRRHVAMQETAILADAVPAHGRGVGRDVLAEASQRLPLGVGL